MKTNNRIPYIDVVITTKDMCEFLTGDKYTIMYVPIKLKDGDDLKQYISVVACTEEEKQDVQTNILENEGLPREEYRIDEKYCHITTYGDNNVENKQISFDDDYDYPIKACFSSEYKNIEQFFKNFIKMRNKLIEEKQLVKDDDIEQYFQASTGFIRNNNETVLNKFKKKLFRK